MSASSSFRIEGSWRASRVAFTGLSMLAGWALAQTDLDRALAVLVWIVALGYGLWTARWSLRPHLIESDGLGGLHLVWPDELPLSLVQMQTYGPCWLLSSTGPHGQRRTAALAVQWSSQQRREFRHRWALRTADADSPDSTPRGPLPRDSAPSV